MWSVHLSQKGPSQMYRASDMRLRVQIHSLFCIFRTPDVIHPLFCCMICSLFLKLILGADVRPETSSTLFIFLSCLMLDDETYKNTQQDCICSSLPLCLHTNFSQPLVINSICASQRKCIGNNKIQFTA